MPVERLPDAAGTACLSDLTLRVHRALAATGAGDLPDNRPAFAQYLLLFEMGGGSELSRLVDFSRASGRVDFCSNSTGCLYARRIGDTIAKRSQEPLGPAARVVVPRTWSVFG